MAFYFAGASVVFTFLLTAFLKDTTTPKTHVPSWIFLAIATLIWPIVVPSIVRKTAQRKAAVPVESSATIEAHPKVAVEANW